MFRRPVARELVRLLVSRKTIFEPFGEEIVELGTQRIDVSDARRAGRHALLGVFLELDEVKVITAILGRRRFGERGGRRGKYRKPRRQRKRLLRSRQEDVNAQFVELDRQCGQRADGVHDKDHFGIFFLERGDLCERRHGASRSFVVDDRERVELASGEFLVNRLGADG